MAADLVIMPDRFKTFFAELETRKALLAATTNVYNTLTTHFAAIEQTLSRKSQTLDIQIASFKSRTQKSLESLEIRECSISQRESTLSARVQELQVSAISDIERSADSENKLESSGASNLSDSLRRYVKMMDSSGLLKFLLTKRRESGTLRADIAATEEVAVDFLGLVVDVVDEFLDLKIEGKMGMADTRWAVGTLIYAAVPSPLSGGSARVVASSLKEKATRVLEKWKGVLGGGEGSCGVGAGEVSMFLQMVVGFGVKDKFEEDHLRKLVVEFANRREMPKLAVALGFGEKMGDIIDELVRKGKEVEAVYFVTESGLTERFPPVTLLKSALKDRRKNANSTSKKGNYRAIAVEEANNLELSATKSIIKCVEDHKLESQFSLESLKKRITQLEKAKADRKKNGPSASKPSNKRAHGGGGNGSRASGGRRPPKVARFASPSPAFRERNPPPLSHQQPRYSSPYGYPGPGQAQAQYGARTQSPVRHPQQYPFPPQDVGPVGPSPSGSFGGPYGAQSHYGAYDYGAPAAAPATYPPATYKL